jgi:hypothetical protein
MDESFELVRLHQLLPSAPSVELPSLTLVQMLCLLLCFPVSSVLLFKSLSCNGVAVLWNLTEWMETGSWLSDLKQAAT